MKWGISRASESQNSRYETHLAGRVTPPSKQGSQAKTFHEEPSLQETILWLRNLHYYMYQVAPKKGPLDSGQLRVEQQ